jgi:capsular exopolysaccharide synthesis family protein
MSLREYLRIVFKHRWLLVAGMLVGLGLAMYTVSTAERSYRSSVAFFVSSAGEGTVSAANLGDQFALRRVNSYLALLKTDRLANLVIEDADLSLSPGAVRSRISGTADLNTVLLTARVDDPNRDQALVIAEAVSRTFPGLVTEVERPAVGESPVRLVLVSGPSVRLVPVATNWILATRVAAGLLIAAVLALIRELADNRLHSVDSAVAMSKAPLLGLITNDRKARRSPLLLDNQAGTPRAEQYRQLRTSLQFISTDSRARAIMLTSSVPSEGKSVTAANLAIAIARSGQRVVLVDADLRKPTQATLFGLEQGAGLTEVLRGQVSLKDVLQPWGSFNLTILTAGGGTSRPSELLGTVAMTRVVRDLRANFDYVLIDTSPLVPITDPAIVSTLVDGVVLLARPDKVTKAQFRQALRILERVHANLLGIVGTMLPERASAYSGGYYGPTRDDSELDYGDELSPEPARRNGAGVAKHDSLLEEALRRAPGVPGKPRP